MKKKSAIIGLLAVLLVIITPLLFVRVPFKTLAIAFFVCLILHFKFKGRKRKLSIAFMSLSITIFIFVVGSILVLAYAFRKDEQDRAKSGRYPKPGKNYGDERIFINDIAHSRKPMLEVKLHLEKGVNPNAKNIDGIPALHIAAGRGNTEIVKLLLEHSANSNGKTKMGNENPLFAACRMKHLDPANLLIDHGTDIHSANSQGETTLMMACRQDKRSDLAKALELDFISRIFPQDEAPVKLQFNSDEILKMINLLLSKGVRIDRADNKGCTALMHLVRYPFSGFPGAEELNVKVVRLLIDRGARLDLKDKDGNTALLLAIKENRTGVLNDVVNVLIDQDAHLDLKDKRGDTALFNAIKNNTDGKHDDIIKRMINNGADINATDSHMRTVLMWACSTSPSTELIEYILDKGGDVHAKDKSGDTALFHAAKSRHFESPALLKLLIDHGADIYATDSEERTILMWACQEKVTNECIEYILDNGGEVYAKDKWGTTAIFYAIRRKPGNPARIKLLVDHGVDINTTDSRKATILMHACWANHTNEMIESILANGCDVGAIDKHFRSAYYYARKYERVIELLRKYDSKSK